MGLTTDKFKKKKVSVTKAKPREPHALPDEIPLSHPIETDKIKVEFDGLRVIYTVKNTGEKLISREYPRVHSLMIIYGRIKKDPHGIYAQQCIAKTRIAMMKAMPIP